MTPEEFVKGFYLEKQDFLDQYFNNSNATTHVSALISELNLDEEGMQKIKTILDNVLTDVFYTILLGIDGAANIGGSQHMYKLLDEEDNKLTGSGEIEAFAYEYFHNTENK
jgi:hypothetical protein